MKAAWAVLLTALLGGQGALSLVCWWCDGADSNWGCWRWQWCSDSDNYCATTYIGGGIGRYSSQSISKGCVPVCPQGGVDIGLAAASINCCSSSLCNISGASSVKSNYLILAMGILASFLYLFGGRLG
ncbi:lymphocyte antigen 6E-like [Heteronotia binoei]|uniref:lymphocyte antigen 6E-like n=1 Tax=Heteronotia binoei TaxID=13085 RepID=UPI002930CDAD|nr:lymphocyte antigen 6E-like [Heteronotia binoei]